ncbi:MAG: hypothetical protein ACPL1F_00980 [bacterium]
MSKIYYYSDDLDYTKNINSCIVLVNNLIKNFIQYKCFEKNPEKAEIVFGYRNIQYVSNSEITVYTDTNYEDITLYSNGVKIKRFLFTNEYERHLLNKFSKEVEYIEVFPLLDLYELEDSRNLKEKSILILDGERFKEVLTKVFILGLYKKYKIKVITNREVNLKEVEVIKNFNKTNYREFRRSFLKNLNVEYLILTNNNLTFKLIAVEALYMGAKVITLSNNFFYYSFKDFLNDRIFVLENFNKLDFVFVNKMNSTDKDIQEYIRKLNEKSFKQWSEVLNV